MTGVHVRVALSFQVPTHLSLVHIYKESCIALFVIVSETKLPFAMS
jgi:hypothetical protein